MNFGQDSVQDNSDLENFIVTESQISRFNVFVHKLNDKCWDVCMNKVQSHLDSRTQSCLVKCVERFLDTSSYIVNRLGETQSRISSPADSMSLD